MDRAEPFATALTALREAVAERIYPPGARLKVQGIASGLRLSPTPVREALSRLAGEGLVEDRRGEGYFTWRLSPPDVAELLDLHLAVLLAALSRPGPPPAASASASLDAALGDGGDALAPVNWSRRLFAQVLRERAGRVLVGVQAQVDARLRPVRRIEPQVLENLAAEARLLAAAYEGGAPRRLAAELRRFHARRRRLAVVFARQLQGEDIDEI
ncbi:GntR family transcriptional regulator [Phenylobacterium deserti]|uniref:HTH gntR-type domain-containing protein n=1 Tax=Phenylobacterium deserti TaxID=1914756 RepID=A0A328AF48_9CAUL|nr:GntR family transcriptional regulator [Phenylobacterium deserti]RAK52756.1 hypothetical protein DJ018_11245 [Phenylobacterium deserti]